LKQANFDVKVADFGGVIKDNTEITSEDIMNISSSLPTEEFPMARLSVLGRLQEEHRRYRFYKKISERLDESIDRWIVLTYDPYVVPLINYGTLGRAEIIPIIHFSKHFRKNYRKIFGLTSYWAPHFLIKNLLRSKVAICLLEEHEADMRRLGYKGKSVSIPYNATREKEINEDNRCKLDNKFRLCTLGLIREDKDIKFVLDTLVEREDVKYYLGGAISKKWSRTEYMRETKRMIKRMKNVEAELDYLSPQKYKAEIEKSHFCVVPIGDKYAKGVQQTGLLVDSVTNKRPVIGPDIFPINKFVKRYGVGELYEIGDKDSLNAAIDRAMQNGVEAYYGKICNYLYENSFENVAKRLRDSIV
jgi:hypothetical protein